MDQAAAAPHAKSPLLFIATTIALLVGAIGGYAFGTWVNDGAYDKGYAQAQTDIRERIAEAPGSTLSQPPSPPSMVDGSRAVGLLNIAGGITAIDGNVLTVVSATRNPDPTTDAYPTMRRVTITSGTSIKLLVPTAAQEITEPEAPSAPLPPSGSPRRPPRVTTSTAKEAKLEDLQVGMSVTVTAASDISYKESFEAVAISATPAEAAGN